MSNRRSVIVLALSVIGFYGAVQFVFYFFSVPQICGCRTTTIPDVLLEAHILENSIRDSNSITILPKDRDLGWMTGTLAVCYSQKPIKGNVDTFVGLAPKGCEYTNLYDLNEPTEIWKTNNEAVMTFEITDRVISIPSPNNNVEQYKNGRTTVRLHINRNNNTCRFSLSEWGGTQLSGRLECADPAFYFNPWSWFPQMTELFYTRAFYTIHHPQTRTPPNQ